jgi:hypothetical protein
MNREWILDPDLDFLPIPDPKSRNQKGTGSQFRIRNIALNISRSATAGQAQPHKK